MSAVCIRPICEKSSSGRHLGQQRHAVCTPQSVLGTQGRSEEIEGGRSLVTKAMFANNARLPIHPPPHRHHWPSSSFCSNYRCCQVLLGVTTICAICAIPVLRPNRPKPGHGLFDSEKPQAVELAQEEARRKKLNIGDRT